jgi:hypothetical protein
MASVEKEAHGFTPAEQEAISRDMVLTVAKNLPLRVAYLWVDGSVRVCPVCDPFFEKITRDWQWEGRTHTGTGLYRRWCGWWKTEQVRKGTWAGLFFRSRLRKNLFGVLNKQQVFLNSIVITLANLSFINLV